MAWLWGFESLVLVRGNDRGHNDDHEEEDDADDNAHAHLHVLPPHLLSDAVGAAAEALRRHCEVVGLVLEGVEALATLRDLVDVVAHNTDSVIDLLQPICVSLIASFRDDDAVFIACYLIIDALDRIMHQPLKD